MNRLATIARKYAASYYSVVLVLLAWELVARSGRVSPLFLPPVSTILDAWWAQLSGGSMVRELSITLYRAMVGLALAVGVGIVVGLAMAGVRAVEWFFDPIIAIGFPMPKVAFIPIFVLWFGIFDQSKIALVFVATVFPVVIATYRGAKSVDQYLLWSAQSLGTSKFRAFYRVVLPATLPETLSGVQIAVPIAFIAVFVAEMVAGGSGLGHFMNVSARTMRTTSVFTGLFTISLVGYLASKAVEILRYHLLVWHEETRSEHEGARA